MYTQCPQCQANFEVTAEQLKIGDGDVRCGQCLSIFNALHYLSESLPVPDEGDAAEHAAPPPVHREPTMGDIDSVTSEFDPTSPSANESPVIDEADVFTSQQIDSIQFPADWQDAATDKTQQDAPADGPAQNAAEPMLPPESGQDSSAAVDVAVELPPEPVAPVAEADAQPTAEALRDVTPEVFSETSSEILSRTKAEHTPETEQEPEQKPAPKPEPPREIFAQPIIEAEGSSQEAEGSSQEAEGSTQETEGSTQETEGSTQKRDTPTAPTEDGPSSNLPAPLLRQLQDEKAASLRPPTTPWVIGSLLMLVLFVAQGSYFYRDALAQQQPELRPWLELACGYLDCRVKRPATRAKIDILGWDVRSLPDTPQALIASTTLINNNPDNQPYPLLTLSFSDINGAPLAQRRFLPREYLPSGTDIKAGMTPDTPVPVELALIDPGKQAVNFEFHTEPARPPAE